MKLLHIVLRKRAAEPLRRWLPFGGEGHRLLCGLGQGGTFGRGQGLLRGPWAGGTHLDLGFLGVCLNNLSSPYTFCSVRL